MSITDDEIERAVASVTPTATVPAPPELLSEMRAAIRAEHRQALLRQLRAVGRVFVAAYVAAGATAGLVALALAVSR